MNIGHRYDRDFRLCVERVFDNYVFIDNSVSLYTTVGFDAVISTLATDQH
jgi:hypothetical protein